MHQRILLLQLKRIGDAILTAPATSALRAQFPGAHLTLVLRGASADLGDAFCDVDEVLSYHPGGVNMKVWSRLIVDRFDLCLDFTGSDRSALMTRLSGAEERIGYRKFSERKRLRRTAFTHLCDASVRDLHTIDFHVALAQAATTGSAPPPRPNTSGFSVTGTSSARLVQLRAEVGNRYAIIHPGTARAEKYWPADRWARVVGHLHQIHGLSCALTGSPDDPEEAAHLRAIVDGAKAPVKNLAGQLSLLDVAALIADADIALGVDSAAMHLAAVLKRPQVVLFGPTNPFHWRPRHKNATVLVAASDSLNVKNFQPRHNIAPMTDLSTNHVCRAIDARLAAV